MKLILAFLFLTNFCVAQTDTTESNFSKGNYKIEYPKSWRLDTSKRMGTEFFLFSPLENQADQFSENVNVIVQDLTGQNINLEDYKTITDKQITDFVTEPKVFESIIKKTGNKEYFRVVYAMTQGKIRLKITSICFIKDDKAYLITFSTELEKHEQYEKIGEKILNSFSLNN
jgi:PsbP